MSIFNYHSSLIFIYSFIYIYLIYYLIILHFLLETFFSYSIWSHLLPLLLHIYLCSVSDSTISTSLNLAFKSKHKLTPTERTEKINIEEARPIRYFYETRATTGQSFPTIISYHPFLLVINPHRFSKSGTLAHPAIVMSRELVNSVYVITRGGIDGVGPRTAQGRSRQ